MVWSLWEPLCVLQLLPAVYINPLKDYLMILTYHIHIDEISYAFVEKTETKHVVQPMMICWTDDRRVGHADKKDPYRKPSSWRKV